MILDVFCRPALLDTVPDPGRAVLLLEGSWPAEDDQSLGWSLDEAVDGRFAWIDREASRLAEQLAADSVREEGARVARSVAPAWLNALALRYFLVKLLRVVVFFSEIQPLGVGDQVEIVARQGQDEDYVELLKQLGHLTGASIQVRWSGHGSVVTEPVVPNERWRRGAAWLSRWLNPRRRRGDLRPRLVLCGNSRLLEPVCREALAQDCAVWWLSDRLAIDSWLRWRRQGVGQLVCQASLGRQNRLRHRLAVPCHYRGVDLTAIVSAWMEQRLKLQGPQQTRLLEEIDRHFHRLKPEALVLDEDATPLARAAVAVAQRQGIASFVVQQEAPACRFGFAPPAADHVLVWGEVEEWQPLLAQALSDEPPCPALPSSQVFASGEPSAAARVLQTVLERQPERSGATMKQHAGCGGPPSPPAPLPQAGEGSHRPRHATH